MSGVHDSRMGATRRPLVRPAAQIIVLQDITLAGTRLFTHKQALGLPGGLVVHALWHRLHFFSAGLACTWHPMWYDSLASLHGAQC